MSFDLYLVSFTDHQPSGIPRAAVREAFGEHVRWDEENYGRTQYSEMDGCSIGLYALKTDAALLSSVAVNRVRPAILERPPSDHATR